MSQRLEDLFPGLGTTQYEVTSPAQADYNCIAWAAGDNTRWWWPDDLHLYYWPDHVRRVSTVEAFAEAFGSLGFEICKDSSFEHGWDKIVVFAKEDGEPTHAARQLSDGKWTSKLGKLEDITHPEAAHLSGTEYGSPVLFLRRRKNIQSTSAFTKQ